MPIGVQLNAGEQWSAGIAYIACPNDIDRELYINLCYKNNRVSIKMEDGSMVNRVPIDEDVLNYIDFPNTPDELGTAVAYITEPQHQHPIIIARLMKSNQLGDGRERMFRIRRQFRGKLLSIDGDLDQGCMNINVTSGDKVGKLQIILDNDADDCLFALEVAGNIDIRTTDSTLLTNKQQFKSIIKNNEKDKEKPSIISQTRNRSLFANKEVVINGEDISAIHYKGYRIAIDNNGISIDSLDKNVTIQAGENKIELTREGINIEGTKISLGGNFEALYNMIPGVPIVDVSQIGISKFIKLG